MKVFVPMAAAAAAAVSAVLLLSLSVTSVESSAILPQGGIISNNHHHLLQPPHHLTESYPYPPPQYDFQYGINDPFSGNFHGHSEAREGSYTQGSYYVHLPDSRLMKVDYYADESGFHPTITYEGEAQYPPAPPQDVSYVGTGAIPPQLFSPSPAAALPPAPAPQISFGPISGPPAPAPQISFGPLTSRHPSPSSSPSSSLSSLPGGFLTAPQPNFAQAIGPIPPSRVISLPQGGRHPSPHQTTSSSPPSGPTVVPSPHHLIFEEPGQIYTQQG